MAKVGVYSIRDNKVTAYSDRLICSSHKASMTRAFKTIINEQGSPYNLYPEDYELYQVGEFETDSGVITPFSASVFICSAMSLYDTTKTTPIFQEEKKNG